MPNLEADNDSPCDGYGVCDKCRRGLSFQELICLHSLRWNLKTGRLAS